MTDVFAYNLSIACNHCVHPKCAGVCPTDAYVVRDDGIVYINASKCMGCGYCAWACPYGAPRYNPETGRMTKCNFCYDNIDAGVPPSCVAACPMRVLDIAEIRDERIESSDGKEERGKIELWNVPGAEHPFPLPTFSRTQPHLAIKPHAGMVNKLEKAISNQEEVKPQRHKDTKISWLSDFVVKGFEELPLIIFTLCGQMAAGMAVISLFSGPLSIPLLAAIGGLIGLGALASIFHLGAPLNAWRALSHLRKSWLSREILMFGLFGASWLVSLAMPGMGKLPLALAGIGLVFSMAQVYRLRSIPAWCNWRIMAGFFVTACLLGGLLAASFLAADVLRGSPVASYAALLAQTGVSLVLLLGIQFWLVTSSGAAVQGTVHRLRLGLIGTGMLGAVTLSIAGDKAGAWIAFPIFLIIMVEETLGRWLFYRLRQ